MANRASAAALVILAALVSPVGARTQTTAPRLAASTPAPDISGTWRRSRRPPDKARRYTLGEIVGSLGEIPPMTAWGEAQFKAAKPNAGPRMVPIAESNDQVVKNCLPPGLPRIYSTRLGGPFEILQVPGKVIMIFEYDHFVREIHTDGRQHSADLNPTWLGDSVGKWEGNTLVVDTIGFNGKTWLDNYGHPSSDALHLVERMARTSHDDMTDTMTIEDPKAYTKPWVAHVLFDLEPGWDLEEYVCEDFLNFRDLQNLSESTK